MTFRVTIKGRREAVVAEMGETILAAALRAGVPYPCGCRSGNCGACKSTLASGEIEMSPYSEYALSKAERDQGQRPGASTDERERIKALERENRELRQANEILRKASAYFAQAELDRRWKP